MSKEKDVFSLDDLDETDPEARYAYEGEPGKGVGKGWEIDNLLIFPDLYDKYKNKELTANEYHVYYRLRLYHEFLWLNWHDDKYGVSMINEEPTPEDILMERYQTFHAEPIVSRFLLLGDKERFKEAEAFLKILMDNSKYPTMDSLKNALSIYDAQNKGLTTKPMVDNATVELFTPNKEFREFFSAVKIEQKGTQEKVFSISTPEIVIKGLESDGSEIEVQAKYVLSLAEDLQFSNGFVFDEYCSEILTACHHLGKKDGFFTLTGVWDFLNPKGKKPGSDSLKSISKRLDAMMSTFASKKIEVKKKGTQEFREWKEGDPYDVKKHEKRMRLKKFQVLPVSYVSEGVVNGNIATIYHLNTLPLLTQFCIDKGHVLNIPVQAMRKGISPKDTLKRRVDEYLTILLSMNRSSKKKTSPQHSFDGLFKHCKREKHRNHPERVIQDLEESLEHYKKYTRYIYDYFIDEPTEKFWIWKTPTEKSKYLKSRPDLAFIKEFSKYHRKRRYTLSDSPKRSKK